MVHALEKVAILCDFATRTSNVLFPSQCTMISGYDVFLYVILIFFAFSIAPKISNYEVSDEYQPLRLLLAWLLKPSISSCAGSCWRLLTNRRLSSIQSCTLLQLSCSCGHRVVSCCLQIPSSGNRNTYKFMKDIEKTQLLYLLISQHRTKSITISLKFHSR